MDLLQRGMDFLSTQRHQHMTQTVTYRRGSESIEMQGTIGPVRVEDDIELDPSIVIAHLKDWIIRKADLVIGGESTEPQRGDVIEFAFRGVTKWYEVLPIVGETVYREIEQGNGFRIHTKEVPSPE